MSGSHSPVLPVCQFLFLIQRSLHLCLFFFFNDTATTEIYTLSLHDALPISDALGRAGGDWDGRVVDPRPGGAAPAAARVPARRCGPPSRPAACPTKCGCACETPGVEYRAGRVPSDPLLVTLRGHGCPRAVNSDTTST